MNAIKAFGAKLLGIGKNLLSFILPILASGVSSYLEQILPIALKIVTELATEGGLSSEQKRKVALGRLGAEAGALGINVGASTLNLALELAVAKFKEGK